MSRSDESKLGVVAPRALLRAAFFAGGLLWISLFHFRGAAAQSTPVHAPTLTPSPTRTLTPTASPTPTRTQSPTPTPLPLIADANCDGRGTAADLSAAIIVSGNAAKFPACAAADRFRDRGLSDRDFIPILADIFDTFAVPWTPTPTPSFTITRTPNGTSTPTRTSLPTSTATASATKTLTPSATATPTRSNTPVPTFTATQTVTRTATVTRTPTATPTPTGLAYRLSGDWAANWGGAICFLNGVPFISLQPTVYHVTAVDGRLDVEVRNGARLGRGLQLDSNNTVIASYTVFDQRVCPNSGVLEQYVFNYAFTFRLNGTGAAAAHWSYGLNTFCVQCTVDDTATLVRVAPPQ